MLVFFVLQVTQCEEEEQPGQKLTDEPCSTRVLQLWVEGFVCAARDVVLMGHPMHGGRWLLEAAQTWRDGALQLKRSITIPCFSPDVLEMQTCTQSPFGFCFTPRSDPVSFSVPCRIETAPEAALVFVSGILISLAYLETEVDPSKHEFFFLTRTDGRSTAYWSSSWKRQPLHLKHTAAQLVFRESC